MCAVSCHAAVVWSTEGLTSDSINILKGSGTEPDSSGNLVLSGSTNSGVACLAIDISGAGINFSSDVYQVTIELTGFYLGSTADNALISFGTGSYDATSFTNENQKYAFGGVTTGFSLFYLGSSNNTGVQKKNAGFNASNLSGTIVLTIGTYADGSTVFSAEYTNTSGTSYELGTSTSFSYADEEMTILGLGTWLTTLSGPNAATISSITVSTIPEPSTFGFMVGLGALIFAVSRRSRNK